MKDTNTQNKEAVIVRFAPSPTGHLHIGGVRTALFNWLFARAHNGKFILRLEDTDRERSEEQYEHEIIESLEWLGLVWDDKVTKQTARLNLYRNYADQLVAKDLAYKVDSVTEAVKLRIPKGKISFHDLVHGTIEFDGDQFDDMVIIKSNGFPTYNFACMIDDFDMGITHVIRGDDHISNTPRQIVIAKSLGFKLPHYAHIPLIFGPDGSPLSKRHGDTALLEYKKQGYPSAGLLNYLALLGWGPPDNKEFFNLKELTKVFSIDNVNNTNAVFDIDKLKFICSCHYKHMNTDHFCAYGLEYIRRFLGKNVNTISEDSLRLLLKLYKSRLSSFSELTQYAAYYFNETVTYDKTAIEKYFSDDTVKHCLQAVVTELSKLKDFNDIQVIEQTVRSLAETLSVKAAALIHPIRVSITGSAVSPGIFEIMNLLGKERVIQRIKSVVTDFENIKTA